MPWTVTAAARPATVGQLEMFLQASWSSDGLYGKDTMLLIGGGLLSAGDRLMEKSRDFVRKVAEPNA